MIDLDNIILDADRIVETSDGEVFVLGDDSTFYLKRNSMTSTLHIREIKRVQGKLSVEFSLALRGRGEVATDSFGHTSMRRLRAYIKSPYTSEFRDAYSG